MSDKTAIERLRELLDERGVEHYDGVENTCWGDTVLLWEDGSNPVYQFRADEVIDGLSVHLYFVTPEQAIAATLGDERIEELEANWNAAKASSSRWRERCVEYESRCYELESLLRDMYSQLRELGIEADYE